MDIGYNEHQVKISKIRYNRYLFVITTGFQRKVDKVFEKILCGSLVIADKCVFISVRYNQYSLYIYVHIYIQINKENISFYVQNDLIIKSLS